MPLDIPQNHIHRIWGEQEPKVEAERYSEMVKWELPRLLEYAPFRLHDTGHWGWWTRGLHIQ